MPRRYRYDAFVSYSHDDRATVDWLTRVLRRTWVPGRLPPRLFVDRDQMKAGGLTEELKRALADSRFLIVCTSPSVAARPRWIDLEIDEFAHAHAENGSHACRAVLACRVGPAPADPPAALRWVARERQDEIFTPDLTGDPQSWSRPERAQRRRHALALLAAILGLRDLDALLRRRTKALLAAAALLVCVGAGYAAWRVWLTTNAGSFYLARRTLLERAETTDVADTPVVHAAAAFGRLNDRDGIEGVARFVRDPDRRAAVTAAGFASLPDPDCERVRRDVERLDASAMRAWPEAPLLAVARCQLPWPDAFADVASSETWIAHLARAGVHDRAVALFGALGDADRFPTAAALAAYGVRGVDSPSPAAWSKGREPHERLIEVTAALERLELRRRLAAAISANLFDVGLQAIPDTDVTQANLWDVHQQFAAHLAAAGRRDEAGRILDAHPEAPAPCPQRGGAVGLAWRSLALRRLGRDGADGAMQLARACAETPIPASRTWGEWRVMAIVHALQGEWPEAFAAADRPEDDRTRVLFAAELVDLWADRP